MVVSTSVYINYHVCIYLVDILCGYNNQKNSVEVVAVAKKKRKKYFDNKINFCKNKKLRPTWPTLIYVISQ